MDTNPVLSEIAGLSPAAQQALLSAHQQITQLPHSADQPAPVMGGPILGTQQQQTPSHVLVDPNRPQYSAHPPPAAPKTLAMPQSMPSLTSPTPQVKAPRGTSAGDEAELSRLESTGSGVSQIHNPILRGLATAGDVLGSTFAPRLTQAIPGSTLHHNQLIAQTQHGIAQDTANEERQAQIEHSQAETSGLNNPAQLIPTNKGYQSINPKTATATPVTTAEGEPVEPVEKEQNIQHAVLPDGSVVAISRGADGKPTAEEVYKGNPKAAPPKLTTLEIGGEQHSVLVDDQGNTIKDLGKTGQKAPVVNVNAGNAELDRGATRLGKAHQASLTAAQAQLEKIEDAENMIGGNAEAQALGIPKVLTALVSGQGTGVRITQAELNQIARARGWQGDFEGTLNKISGKGQLTAVQQQQLKGILEDTKSRIQQKMSIANEALDSINGASTREQQIEADKNARQKLNAMETGGGASGKGVSLKDAMALPANAGKSADDVRKDIQSHGHTVIE